MSGCLILLLAVILSGGACVLGGPYLSIPVLLFCILLALVDKR